MGGFQNGRRPDFPSPNLPPGPGRDLPLGAMPRFGAGLPPVTQTPQTPVGFHNSTNPDDLIQSCLAMLAGAKVGNNEGPLGVGSAGQMNAFNGGMPIGPPFAFGRPNSNSY